MTREPTDKERGPVPGPPMSVEEVARLTNLQSTFRHAAKVMKEVKDEEAADDG